jgi:uncharacterized protein YodC (DUF2158 family)
MFKIGDVVTLKSGGPRMTVHWLAEDGDEVEGYQSIDGQTVYPVSRPDAVVCIYFDDEKVLRDSLFYPEQLTGDRPLF